MSELDNVKQQVDKARNDIADSLMAVQQAESEVNDRSQRLAALGIDGTAQALRAAGDKLSSASAHLQTAHSTSDAVVQALNRLSDTMPLSQLLEAITSASTKLEETGKGVKSAFGEAGEALNLAQQTEVEPAMAAANNAVTAISQAQQTADTAKTTIEDYQGKLEDAAQAGLSGTGPSSASSTSTEVLHGAQQRRAGNMEGPVIFSAPEGMSPMETGQAKEYIDAANTANREGQLSPTGRVSLDHELKRDKLAAAAKERKRAKAASEPYGEDVAAHLPDTTWVGQPDPPGGWGRHTKRLNSTLGSQSAQYPVGYRPTKFQLDGTWTEADASR
ncbi:MAG: hypothetical protein ACRDXX_01250 [Stackebrandtia sp.]